MSNLTRENVIADMEEAAERMGLDLEDLQEMIVDVIDDCLSKAKLLLKAVGEKSASDIKSIAHDIKGASANYGLLSPSALALKLEKSCDDPSTAVAEELVADFDQLKALNLA